MTKITAPVEGYEGTIAGVVFKDGVAETSNDAVIAYCRAAGYGIDDSDPAARPLDDSEVAAFTERARLAGKDIPDDLAELLAEEDPAEVRAFLAEPFDPRDLKDGGIAIVGTALRDASIDPRPEDFLPPTNAGDANPHGPLVVAPGIHAIETQVVRPGPVHVEDLAAQQAAETEQAVALLVENQDVGDALPSFDADRVDEDGNTIVGADRGPLGLSDPGSVTAVETGDTADQEEPTNPDGSEVFDPAAHNVDDVLAYLSSADADEHARVLAAEETGKARKGVLEHQA